MIAIKAICPHCQTPYEIPSFSDGETKKLAIDFAICNHCRLPRRMDLLIKFWGQPRCWLCRVPFAIKPEASNCMCASCMIGLYRFKQKQITK